MDDYTSEQSYGAQTARAKARYEASADLEPGPECAPLPAFQIIMSAIHDLNEAAESAMHRSERISIRMFGSRPRPATNDRATPSLPDGLIPDLALNLQSIMNQIWEANSNLARIEDQLG